MERKEIATRRKESLQSRPGEIEEQSNRLFDSIERAEATRGEAADRLAEGETALAEADKALRAAEAALAEAREVRIRAEAQLEQADGECRVVAERVSERLGCKAVSVTRGSAGCLCYRKSEGFFEIPALTRNVVDRIGAGDSFLALSALAVQRGLPMELVGFLGNVAGAEAVATVGNRDSLEFASLAKHLTALLR